MRVLNLTNVNTIFRVVWIITVVIIAGLLGDAYAETGGEDFWSPEKGAVWVLVLFLIPVFFQVLGLIMLDFKLRRLERKLIEFPDDQENKKDFSALTTFSIFYLGTMFICLLSYSIFWLKYITGDKNSWNKALADYYYVLSIRAVGVISLLLVFVLIMTYAVITGATATREVGGGQLKKHVNYLKRGASKAPFIALLFFLTVFLGVSYLFGFALAFHDKTQDQKKPALFMRNLTVPEPASLPSSPSNASPFPSPSATFRFISGKAFLILKETDVEIGKRIKPLCTESA